MRLAVPESWKSLLLAEVHSGRFAGHFAEKSLYGLLNRRYWWDGMRGDVRRKCRECLTCVTRKGPGRSSFPPLKPIPVGGPFECVGVDVLQLPQTVSGSRYVVVFMDYLTKWPEAFSTSDQSAETIAKLLVEHIICRHGVPQKLLSDRGANFLSSLVLEICQKTGIQKINTSAYHPQTDGVVEKFNHTLLEMIAKHAAHYGVDWDRYLGYLLFAYWVKPHDATGESLFYLLYGRDAKLPLDSTLAQPPSRYQVDLQDYRTEVTTGLHTAWRMARTKIAEAQEHYKKQYDKKAKQPAYRVGDRVFIHMPQMQQGKLRKLARPYCGPYRVEAVTPTNIRAVPVDKPNAEPILRRVRPSYPELPNVSWTGKRRRKRTPRVASQGRPPKYGTRTRKEMQLAPSRSPYHLRARGRAL